MNLPSAICSGDAGFILDTASSLAITGQTKLGPLPAVHVKAVTDYTPRPSMVHRKSRDGLERWSALFGTAQWSPQCWEVESVKLLMLEMADEKV